MSVLPFHQTLVGATYNASEVELQRSNTELSMKSTGGTVSSGNLLNNDCSSLVGFDITGTSISQVTFDSESTFQFEISSSSSLKINTTTLKINTTIIRTRYTGTLKFYPYKAGWTSGDWNNGVNLFFRYSGTRRLYFGIAQDGIYTRAEGKIYSDIIANNMWHTFTFDYDSSTNLLDVYLDNVLVVNGLSTLGYSNSGTKGELVFGDISHNNDKSFYADYIKIGDTIEPNYPTTSEITLSELNSGDSSAVWDMSSINFLENPNSEAGDLLYKYATKAEGGSYTYNGSWLTLAQLQAESDPTEQYMSFKVQLSSNGSQDATFGGGYLEVTITIGGDAPNDYDLRAGVVVQDVTGTLIVPSENDVRVGTNYDVAPNAKTGNLGLPLEFEVVDGVGYGSNDTEFEGTYEPPIEDYPSEDDVRNGVVYDEGILTGNLELPAENKVSKNTQYGANGTEFTGTLESAVLTDSNMSIIIEDDVLNVEIA